MIHTLLKNKRVILASSSPRRKEIFDFVGIKAVQFPADVDEECTESNPIKFIRNLSKRKCEHVYKQMESDCIVVAADTIVYLDKTILGKPIDKAQAKEFLQWLSGSTHYVYTGVTVAYKHTYYSSYVKSKVEFIELNDNEIDEYIATDEPLDKAGAYGIQGFGSQFIKKINGCYFNVMGFPISLFYKMLKEILSLEK